MYADDTNGASGTTSCVGMQDRARELVHSGHDVVHLDLGELDFDTPEPIVDAAIRALREHHTRYTHSFGSPDLREAICAHYRTAYGVQVNPAQVLVHAGSSPMLLLLFLAVLAPGDEVLIPDPGYPAYATSVRMARGVAKPISATRQAAHYTAGDAAATIDSLTKAVVVNSPCNPTGSVLGTAELAEFGRLGPLVVSDEAYHGLWLRAGRPHSMLEFSDNVAVLNTFSKTFAMTGWRLGYLIAPPRLIPELEPLQRDCVLSPNAFVQRAGITALAHIEAITSGWRDELGLRRDILIQELTKIGFTVPLQPEGGFYVFARLPAGYGSTIDFAVRLLEEESVAVVAGDSFGAAGAGYLRCSFALSAERIREGTQRIASFLAREHGKRPVDGRWPIR